MKRGDTVTLDGVGDLLVKRINGDYVTGTWQSGVLKGRDAGCSKRALLGHALSPEPPKERPKSNRVVLRGALLKALTAGPVDLHVWAHAQAVSPHAARGAIGALRRAGHQVRALGDGKFEL